MILCDGRVDLRLGRWQDVLAYDVVDALLCDPPYSSRTHAATNEHIAGSALPDAADRMSIAYEAMSPFEMALLLSAWAPRVRGWIGVMTSHDLIPEIEVSTPDDRLCFAPVPIIQKRPRLVGDGPSSWAIYMIVSRPRTRAFATWGCLPGAYEAPTDRTGIVAGGKPLDLMRAIVRDYTKPDDLVADPFCGGGTTALACAMEGRRCVTSEVDPATFEKARARLSRGFTADLFGTRGT